MESARGRDLQIDGEGEGLLGRDTCGVLSCSELSTLQLVSPLSRQTLSARQGRQGSEELSHLLWVTQLVEVGQGFESCTEGLCTGGRPALH